jgi:hypothetical protein
MRDKVTRLRQLLSEAVPIEAPKSLGEQDAWRRWHAHAENDPLPCMDTSYRAKRIRDINRIAISYGWAREIQHFLDRQDAAGIASLDDDGIELLHDRMTALEGCVQAGCDPPEMPPAR